MFEGYNIIKEDNYPLGFSLISYIDINKYSTYIDRSKGIYKWYNYKQYTYIHRNVWKSSFNTTYSVGM